MVILINDSPENVLNPYDFKYLIEKYMGSDALDYYITYILPLVDSNEDAYSEELYSNDYVEELTTSVEWLKQELEDLKSENAFLKIQLETDSSLLDDE